MIRVMSEKWRPPRLPIRLRRLNLGRARAVLGSVFTRKRVALLAGVFLAFLIITPIATYAYYARDISDRERLMNRKDTGVVLKDKNGQVFYEQGTINGTEDVPLSAISDHVETAIIASEDKDFYNHDGFSPKGIAMAMYANVMNHDSTRYGGSTITQQLVKNTLLSTEKSFLRKYQELSMAIAVDREYSKQEILEMYLNSVYFGEGAFGIADAARIYYGKAPADLTLAESAMLVGLLPAPNAYSPISGDAALARAQQQRVLGEMVENGTITKADKAAAEQQQLAYAPPGSDDTFGHAQHYALMVLDQLQDEYGEERVTRSGFVVTTTLDLNLQKQAEDIVARRVATFASGGGNNASLVAIEPKNGFVSALVGSVDWNNTEFGKVNMAMAPRQPGSSFKPIYYTEAIDKKVITAATVLKDEPRDFAGWKPNNFDFKFKGNMTARSALAESRNIPAVEVMEKLGVRESAAAAQRMGISTVTEPDKYGLTLSLGTAEARLYEMTNAYAAFANGGLQHKPVLFTEIRDKYSKTVHRHDVGEAKRVMSEEASFVISNILSDNNARAPTFGSSLNISGRPVAVKTGTTDESKDAWTIGYTPSLAVGVWVGNNQAQPMRGLAGGSSAGLIWRDAMTGFTADKPREAFAVPSGVAQRSVCVSGKTYNEYFVDGSQTVGNCNIAREQEQRSRAQRDEEERRKQEEANALARQAADEGGSDQDATRPNIPEEGGRGGGSGQQPGGTPGGSGGQTEPTPEPTQPTDPATPPASERRQSPPAPGQNSD